MMPSSNRDEKNLPMSNKLKHGLQALQLNAQSAADKLNSQKLRPAIPAQKPNQPRLWLACACQRWSRKPQARPILAIEQRQLGPIIIGLEFGKRWQGGAHGFSSEQPGIEGEWHGLADFDFGKIGMRRIDEVVGFAGDDAWQGEQRGAGVFRPRITDLLGGV